MKLTVSQRIWGGFILITFLLIAIGINSLIRINSISDSSNQVNTLSIPALTATNELEVSFNKMQSLALKIYYSSESSQLETLVNNYRVTADEFNQSNSELKRVVSSNQELSRAAQNIDQTYSSFSSRVNNLIENKTAALRIESSLSEQLENLRNSG